MAKHLLVLGAGASWSYGFPLARALVDEICFDHTRLSGNVIQDILEIRAEEFQRFAHRVRISDPPSIDWLAQFVSEEEFVIAKKLIAFLIAHREVQGTINRWVRPDDAPHWMRFLGNQLLGSRLSDFPMRDIAILTFNYDRSVEQYLWLRLFETFKDRETGDEIMTAFKRLEIVHVYGHLGTLPNFGEQFRAYEPIKTREDLAVALRSMHLLPEVAKDTKLGARTQATELMRKAEKAVTFLGFAYSDENLAALGLPGSIPAAATAYGTVLGFPYGGPRDELIARLGAAGVPRFTALITGGDVIFDVYQSLELRGNWILGPPRTATG